MGARVLRRTGGSLALCVGALCVGALCVGALCLGLVVPATSAVASPATPARGAVAVFPAADDAEQTMFTWLNQERTSRGVPALARNTVLDGYGQGWSDFMAAGGCVAREGRRLCHRLDLKAVATAAFPGAWSGAAENVGLVPDGGTLESLHQAFMDSPGHRANALGPTYTAVGLGIAFDATGTLFVTYEFVAEARNTGSTPPGLPEPQPGTSEEDTLLLWINDLRAERGLAPLARHPVLDREAETWSATLAAGMACRSGTLLCHRRDMSAVAKTAVGARGSRWWAENVGLRNPASVGSQFQGFVASVPHRANMLRADVNLVGIGYVFNPDTGRAYTTLDFVTARQPLSTLPPGGNACGWVQSTIGKGATGPRVRTLQCALAAAGVYTGPVDGVYGPGVVTAVKTYQARLGVKRPSGRADLKTRRALGVV